MPERQPLVDKKKGRTGTSSVVWKHFGFELSDVEQKEIVCKLCRTIVTAARGNTTNLINHLLTGLNRMNVLLFVQYFALVFQYFALQDGFK